MPFYNFNSGEVNIPFDDVDYCIIGAGAAGILLAVRLRKLGKRVLVIESGHFVEDEARQQLNEVEQTGKTLTSSSWGRKRAIGGTTIAWGGQSLPFSTLDFEERPWVRNSGWPIRYADLKEFYDQANAFMKIDQMDFCDDIFNLLKMNRPDLDGTRLLQHFSKWAPEPNFRKICEKELRENVALLYNANLTRITFLDGGEQIRLRIHNYEGKSLELTVPKLILATGGIETNRILLTNNHQFKGGIGNHSGWLGKCFMEHPCLNAGSIKNYASSYALQRKFNTHVRENIKYSVKLSLSNHAQVRHRLLNASASLLFLLPEEGFDPYNEIRFFLKTRNLKHFFKVAKNSKNLFYTLGAYIRHRFVYKHNAVPHLVFMLEQEPLEESCIRLSKEVDRFGIPKAKVNWAISRLTWESALSLAHFIREDFRRLNIGELDLPPGLGADNPDWQSCLSDVNHHMGGARMSATSDTGVVNSYGQVWGLENLYVCSAAVFPTSSFSNPTLTLLALCERLARQL
ncbi:GMC family oxidoreductase [Paraflavisolibacter sp. H34]|uniref:GMC family oxidoreductase n=1 Tax=Huijunlia imazamoxiresistens TaxID=3127457 RepID=UPI0030195F51